MIPRRVAPGTVNFPPLLPSTLTEFDPLADDGVSVDLVGGDPDTVSLFL